MNIIQVFFAYQFALVEHLVSVVSKNVPVITVCVIT